MQFCEWEASVAGQEGHEPHATINEGAGRRERRPEIQFQL
jgi:hypothetical protein